MAIQRIAGLPISGALRFGGLPLAGASRVMGLGPLPAGLGPIVSIATPAAYWTFEEDTWVEDSYGDPTGDILDVAAPSGAYLEATEAPFSITTDKWFGVHAAAGGGTNYFADSVHYDGGMLTFWFKGSVLVYLSLFDNPEPDLLFPAELAGKAEWTHAVLVWRSDWAAYLYLNGVLAASGFVTEPGIRDRTIWTFLLEVGSRFDELAYWRGTVVQPSEEQDMVNLLYNEGFGAVWRDDQWWEVAE